MDFRPLKQHQELGFQYGLKCAHPAILMEMRLGKTLLWIRLCSHKQLKYNLVVGPINVLDGWIKELEREEKRYVAIFGVSKDKRLSGMKRAFLLEREVFVLINYESLRSSPEIADMPWDSVVLDESVKIKNPWAQITKLCLDKFRTVKCRGILTGLVVTESLLDLFNQFCFLHGSFLQERSFWGYRLRYFEVTDDGYTWKPKKDTKDMIKSVVHAKAFIMRRQDAGFFAEKIHSTRMVEMNAAQKKLYNQINKDFEYTVASYASHEDPVIIDTMWATEKFLWLSRIAGGFTPDGKECISTAISEEILYLLQNDFVDQQVVIYYKFKAELDFDFDFLGSRGIQCSKIKGLPMTMNARREQEENWQSGNSRVLQCMEEIAKHGKDFSKASIVIYRSNLASCDARAQSEDRIYHMNKQEPLFFVDIVTRNTVNEALTSAVKEKVYTAKEFITNFKREFDWINQGRQGSFDLEIA